MSRIPPNALSSIALFAVGFSFAVLGCGTSSTGGAGSEGSESGSGEGSGGAPSGSAGGGESDGSGAAPSTGSAPPSTGAVDANTVYVPEQDPAKAQEIATRMWTILTAPLSGLSTSDGLRVAGNRSLTNLDGLEGVSLTTWLAIVGNDALTNLDGLSGLTSVSFMLEVQYNAVLTNVDALPA